MYQDEILLCCFILAYDNNLHDDLLYINFRYIHVHVNATFWQIALGKEVVTSVATMGKYGRPAAGEVTCEREAENTLDQLWQRKEQELSSDTYRPS